MFDPASIANAQSDGQLALAMLSCALLFIGVLARYIQSKDEKHAAKIEAIDKSHAEEIKLLSSNHESQLERVIKEANDRFDRLMESHREERTLFVDQLTKLNATVDKLYISLPKRASDR